MTQRIAALFWGLALVTGAALTGWGLAHLDLPQALYWSDNGAFTRYAIFLAVSAALVGAGASWSRRSALLVGGVLAGTIVLLSGALWPLLVAGWFAVASVLLGRAVRTLLHMRGDCEMWPADLLVGAGIYGTFIGLLAHFPVNYPGVYGAALALPVLLCWRSVAAASKRLLARVSQREAGFVVQPLEVAIAAVALVHVVVALMPEIGYDALAMHLVIPAHLAARHEWGFDAATYVWAVMPMLGDWIFALGYLLAGETASRLLNVGFIFILCLLVRDLVRWAGGSDGGARWAVLIFLSTPLTFTESSTLFIESIWASLVVAGAFAVLKACSPGEHQRTQLLSAGILLGCALAAKAGTYLILPVPLVLLILCHRSWLHLVRLRSLVFGFGLFLALGSIPYVTAWSLTGNPMFPFFNAFFRSPLYPLANFDASVVVYGRGITWDVLYRATFLSGKYLEAYPGASGFQWLLLFFPVAITLFAARLRRGVVLFLMGAAVIVLVFMAVNYFRYAFPAWAFLAAAMGVALGHTTANRRFLDHLGHAAAAAAVVLNLLFLSAGTQYRDFPLAAIGDEQRRNGYLLGRLPLRSAIAAVNHLNGDRSPVAIFASSQTAGLSADALLPSWYNHVFQGEMFSVKTEKDLVDLFLKRNIKYALLDSYWSGWQGWEEIRALVKKTTRTVATYGSVSVLEFTPVFRYETELLINHDFAVPGGWLLPSAASYDATSQVITASVDSQASQAVAVSPKLHYLNAVVARCAQEAAPGRMQINWLDGEGHYITTSIQTFECTPDWAEHRMEVVAPEHAAKAVVYVAGHSSMPLQFKSNSLRY